MSDMVVGLSIMCFILGFLFMNHRARRNVRGSVHWMTRNSISVTWKLGIVSRRSRILFIVVLAPIGLLQFSKF